MNYIFHKFVFLFGVLNIEEFEELLTWITWLALVGFFAIWVSMTKMRSEYVREKKHKKEKNSNQSHATLCVPGLSIATHSKTDPLQIHRRTRCHSSEQCCSF